MKKYLAMLLALVMVLALCACGNTSAPAADPTQAPAENTGDANAEQPAEEDLVSLAQAEGELVVYGSCEEEYLAAACQNFEKLYGIKTTYQRLSTGEVQAKIEEENGNPSADVWFGGTTDPYNVVAAEGLLEAYEAENASHLISDVYRNATATGTASTRESSASWSTPMSSPASTSKLLRIGRICSSPNTRA